MDKKEEELGHQLAEGRKKREYEYAITQKQLAQIREQQDADCAEIKANGNLVVAKLNKERDIAKAKILSGGKAEAEKIKTETDVYIRTQRADADAVIAKNVGISLGLEAESEEYAAKQLVAKRLYEKKMRSLQSLRGLATNDNVLLVGNNGDNITAQLVANQKGGAVLGINQ